MGLVTFVSAQTLHESTTLSLRIMGPAFKTIYSLDMVVKCSEHHLHFLEMSHGFVPRLVDNDGMTELQGIPEPLASDAKFMKLIGRPETAIGDTKEMLDDRPQPAARKTAKALGINFVLAQQETVRPVHPRIQPQEMVDTLHKRTSKLFPSSVQRLCQLSRVRCCRAACPSVGLHLMLDIAVLRVRLPSVTDEPLGQHVEVADLSCRPTDSPQLLPEPTIDAWREKRLEEVESGHRSTGRNAKLVNLARTPRIAVMHELQPLPDHIEPRYEEFPRRLSDTTLARRDVSRARREGHLLPRCHIKTRNRFEVRDSTMATAAMPAPA